MSETIFLLTISILFGTIVLVFGMKYFSSMQQARARLANDEAYRQLAAQASAAQAEGNARLAAMEGALSEVRGRVAAIEKMLKEVD